MVKKLQALKAKKGFTLVELIVVIAIIGVLAAILIPTLSSQITKSRVTSADSTAKEIIGTVNTWLTENETQGGKQAAANGIIEITMSRTTCTVSGAAPSRAADNPEELASKIIDEYPNASFGARVYLSEAGKAYACLYEEKATAAPSIFGAGTTFPTSFGWDSAKKVGVASGTVYGTSPKVNFA